MMDRDYDSEGEDAQIKHNEFMLQQFQAQANQHVQVQPMQVMQQPFWNPFYISTPIDPAITTVNRDDINSNIDSNSSIHSLQSPQETVTEELPLLQLPLLQRLHPFQKVRESVVGRV